MAETTPMMRQYQEIKEQHRDKVLFFRLGDFYEMFQDDAREASRLLGLTLTHRHGEPMCGIPYHSAQPYIRKLLEAGRSIAVCEQVSVPGADKGIVRREVIDVLTPGTVVEDGYLGSSKPNYTVALAFESDLWALTAADLSTGDLRTTTFRLQGRAEALERELSRFQPRELLVAENVFEAYPFFDGLLKGFPGMTVTKLPVWRFDRRSGHRRLLEHFGVLSLQAFGLDDRSFEVVPTGALIEYWQLNSPGRSLGHLRTLIPYQASQFLQIDPQSTRSLELTANTRDGGPEYTLFSVLDKTLTAAGSRLLRTRLLFPLVDRETIEKRLDGVEVLVSDSELLEAVRSKLTGQLDIERLAARLSLDKASPRDLVGLETSVRLGLDLAGLVTERAGALDPGDLWSPGSREKLQAWVARIGAALMRDPAPSAHEGGLIQSGFDSQLDGLRHLKDHSQEVLDAYLVEEQQAAGLPQLRIRYNKIIGYFFEVTKARLDQLPGHFRRKQSLVGSERFTTPRLGEIEETLLHAQDRIFELEYRLFLALRDEAKALVSDFQALAVFSSGLDVSASLARTSILQRYVRPIFSEVSELVLDEARHPVVESTRSETPFVPNSVAFSPEDKLFLITGPNMAGKSTYLRQTALIVLMGQIGSFVPATSARWAPVDRIFCRVGASDHLARGESTFLVEMNETAHILRNATPASLVIMDEVGRGTGTRDGFSLAWAICEHLLENVGAKTLFATHFHELTALTGPGLKNFSMAVVEEGEEVVFLRRVVPGAADHSYGLHVARLAGVPGPVLVRAAQILQNLPPEDGSAVPKRGFPRFEPDPQLELFAPEDRLRIELRSLDVDNMTPLDALNTLARLKKEAKG
jgi:DNA mismatch repair protein MutS